MEKIDTILVGLDIPDISAHLIKYAGFVADMLGASEIIFTHIYRSPDFPEEVLKELQSQGLELESRLEEEMAYAVSQYLPPKEGRDVSYAVASGPRLTTFLSVAKSHDTDLIILGRKHGGDEDGSGLLLSRVARMAASSVMIVPEGVEMHFDSLMVCSDFSDCSRLALQQSMQFAKNNPHATVYLHHVYQVPTGYHVSGKSFTDFANIMKKHAVNKSNSFLKAAKVPKNDIVPVFTVDRRGKPAQTIKEASDSIKASLVVVGSKGRTFAASIFLGSFAEKLVRLQKNSALLVVKRKNEVMGVIDALKSL